MRRQEQQSALDAFRERGSRQGIKLPPQGAQAPGGAGGLPGVQQSVPSRIQQGHLQPGSLTQLPQGPALLGQKLLPDAPPSPDLASRFKCAPTAAAGAWSEACMALLGMWGQAA